jgi:cellulose synthase/poly-beta-1,6-N-acetylglucosamine synthase-like glycosyltransferase
MSLLILLPLALASAVVALLTGVFLVEVLAAFMNPRVQAQSQQGTTARQPLAIVIPAHNEGPGIQPTLDDVKAQLRRGDRLLVVADNCTDDTAAIASAAGAEVIERHDPTRRGKGFALDFALKHLSQKPPDCVIFIDADCRISPGAIDALALACERAGRPVQALYLMAPPLGYERDFQLSAFAWRVKNYVRPLGLKNLHRPCQLMGTGMAFPWFALQTVNLASGHVVEDLKLGLDATAAGHPPVFLPGATVSSEFPTSTTGMQTQRERWEGGHLSTIVR